MGASARRGAAPTAAAAQVLAYRQHCQRLDQRTSEPLPEVVAAIGYVGTPGGVTPYLSLRARSPRFDRRLLERAAFEAFELVELPFARNTTALAPPADAPLLLAAARRTHEARLEPLAAGGALDAKKLAKLAEAILSALGDSSLAADDLRARLPEALCVPLGEAGRKIGLPSLFTVALKALLHEGRVVRREKAGRLDREGALYALPRRPFPELDRPTALAALARRYFRAYAPASATAFAFWADCSVSEARAAVVEAELATVAVEGSREPWYLASDLVDAFAAFEPPIPPRLAFVPFRDPSVSGGRDLKGMMSDANQKRALADWRGRLVAAGGGSNVHQHFLLLGGYVAGIWEYDSDEKHVRYATFDPLPTRMRRAADDAADELAAFITGELGAAPFYADERAEQFGKLDAVVASWR